MQKKKNPHIREITNEYLKCESERVENYFRKLEKKKEFMGQFAIFYRKFLRQKTDPLFFINIFQEVNNILSRVTYITRQDN